MFSPLVDQLIDLALTEDLSASDLTTDVLFGPHDTAYGRLIAKESLVLSGQDIFCTVLHRVDPGLKIHFSFKDEDHVPSGALMAQIYGSARSLLRAERVALNFLQRMCGVATFTRRYVEAIPSSSKTRIVDTRKTTPGMRELQKYSVMCGGGKNHRFNLGSGVMIKDNHIKAAGGIRPAVEKIRAKAPHTTRIEVEVTNREELTEALDAGADIVLLDNMTVNQLKQSIKQVGNRAITEISGNVTLDNLPELATLGADIISSGALTHSTRASDISLKFEHLPNRIPWCLSSEADLLRHGLAEEGYRAPLTMLDTTKSTNLLAEEALRKTPVPAIDGSVFIADTQTDGRGRSGTNWFSPKGSNLHLSLLYKRPIPPDTIQGLTLAAAVAVARALEEVTGLIVDLKWPNDLFYKGRKLGGILTQGVISDQDLQGIIVGVGLNINTTKSLFPEKLRSSATSLLLETGKLTPRHHIAVAVIRQLKATIDQFTADGLEPFLNPWKRRAPHENHPCLLESGPLEDYKNHTEPCSGTILGLDKRGTLQVKLDSGEVRTIRSGSVSYIPNRTL